MIQQLSGTKIDTSLFRSSKSLGAVKESKKEKARRALLESRKGVNEEENKKLLYKERIVKSPSPESSEDEEDQTEDATPMEVDTAPAPEPEKPAPAPVQIGSGLKRPLELGEDGFPVLAKRQRVRKPISRLRGPIAPQESDNDEDSEDSDSDVDSDGNHPDDMEDGSGSEESEDSEEESEDESEEEAGSDDASEEGSDEEGGKPENWDYETILKKAMAIFDEKAPSKSKEGDEEVSGNEESEEDDEDDSEEGSDEEEESEGSGTDESEDEDMEDAEEVPLKKKGTSERASAFKEWARQQKNIVVSGSAEQEAMVMPTNIPKSAFASGPRDESPVPEDVIMKEVQRKVFSVVVKRPEAIQTARLSLPVVGDEQRIMEAIHANDCIVLCGETGSGKTTQVPQFLFEAGYGSPGSDTPGMVGVTQPRRVAAVSMAKRVGQELGEFENRVAYQVCFSSCDVGFILILLDSFRSHYQARHCHQVHD